jgi:alpha-tubulin suppressor-like RCC1 family protein
MAEYEIDPAFEARLGRQLFDAGSEAVRPFDAVQIARDAAAADDRGWRSRLPMLPARWRPVLLFALLAVALIGVGVFGGLIKLPNNNIAPDPSFQPFSPPPTVVPSPGSPTQTPNGSPLPSTVPSFVLPSGGPTFPPLPTETPSLLPTEQPTVSPTPSPTPTPTPSATVPPPPTPSPTPTPAIKVVAVAEGDLHSCAVTADGRVFCWGTNDMGPLGDGTTQDRYTADIPVTGIDDAVAISAGIRFSCAVRADGTVWCWGEDPGSDGSSAVPFQVVGIDDAQDVTAGGAFACALRRGGEVACWGNGQVGQLGNGVYENNSGVPTPEAVVGIDNAVAVSAGWAHACALLADGTVECWGGNGDGVHVYGSLGDGTNDVRRSTPAPVVGLDNVVEVRAGGWSTCARTADGEVWCWGYGEHGLGNGQAADSNVPVDTGIDDAKQIAVGGYGACATRADDSIWCWGDTFWRQSGGMGTVPVEGNRTEPAVVTALATNRHLLLIDGYGRVWEWGRGSGDSPQLIPVGP